MLQFLIPSLLISSAHATFVNGVAFLNPGASLEIRALQGTLHVEGAFKQKASTSHSCQSAPFKKADILEIQGIESLQEESLKKVEAIQQDKTFQEFQKQALEAGNKVLESGSFQGVVSALKSASPSFPQPLPDQTSGELFIFVSFSLGEKGLLNLAHDAKRYRATLVLRGFREGSYAKTVKALQKIITKTNHGVIVDPELFSLFAIQSVPTYVLAKPFQLNAQERIQTPVHDRIQGHVTLQYTLENFAREGDLKAAAKTLLVKGGSK